MKPIALPSQEYLNSLFEYNVQQGSLHWKPRPGKKCNHTKSRAGCYTTKGYRIVRIDGRLYKEHRVIWVMHNGPIPDDFDIDHIDYNKDNNRIDNLQCISRQANLARRPCGPGRSR